MENQIVLPDVDTDEEQSSSREDVGTLLDSIISYGMRPTDITFVLGVARQTLAAWRNGTRPITDRRYNTLLSLRDKAKAAAERGDLPILKEHKEQMQRDYLMKMLYRE